MTDISIVAAKALISDSIERCRAIRDRCAVLLFSEFASSNPEAYAALLHRIATALESELSKRVAKLDNDLVNATSQVRLIDDFVKDVGADIRYIEAATTAKLPWSLSRPFEVLLKRYLPNKTLMLRPQWKHNYSIHIVHVTQRYAKELGSLLTATELTDVFGTFPAELHIVSFPAVERKNALLHCDLAHEIGHLVAEDYLSKESSLTYVYTFRDAIAKEVEKDSNTDPLWRTSRIAEMLQEAAYIRRRALEEMISDVFAVRVLGPASLFALSAFAIGQSLDMAPDVRSDYYPPWRMRLRVVLEEMNRAGLAEVGAVPTDVLFANALRERVAGRIADAQSMVSVQPERAQIESTPLLRLAYKSALEALPLILSNLETRYGHLFLKTEELYPRVYYLVERLTLGVPPNEITVWVL